MSNKGTTHTDSKLVVLSAPSGSGKSTIVSMITDSYEKSFKLSISHTTRLPRGNEKNGLHYFFVSEDKFKEMISHDAFLEYAHVYNKHWYGTSRKFVEDTLASNKNVLFDIDVQGAANLKQSYSSRCMTIFIHPPSLQELERRLRNRKTDSADAIKMRLETARKEILESHKFDYQVTNNDLKNTFLQIEHILKKEHCI